MVDDYSGDNALQTNATENILGIFGYESGAVRWYQDAQGGIVHIFLISFSGADGAQAYGLSLASSRLQDGNVTEFSDSTAATGYGYAIPISDGYTETDVLGYCGNVLVQVHVIAKGGSQDSSAASLFSAQYAAAQAALR